MGVPSSVNRKTPFKLSGRHSSLAASVFSGVFGIALFSHCSLSEVRNCFLAKAKQMFVILFQPVVSLLVVALKEFDRVPEEGVLEDAGDALAL